MAVRAARIAADEADPRFRQGVLKPTALAEADRGVAVAPMSSTTQWSATR